MAPEDGFSTRGRYACLSDCCYPFGPWVLHRSVRKIQNIPSLRKNGPDAGSTTQARPLLKPRDQRCDTNHQTAYAGFSTNQNSCALQVGSGLRSQTPPTGSSPSSSHARTLSLYLNSKTVSYISSSPFSTNPNQSNRPNPQPYAFYNPEQNPPPNPQTYPLYQCNQYPDLNWSMSPNSTTPQRP